MKNFKIQHALILLAVVIPASLISCNKVEEVKLTFNVTVPDNWTYVIVGNEGLVYSAGRNPVNNEDTIREEFYVFRENLAGWNLPTYYSALREIIINRDAFNSIIYESDTTINQISFKKMRSSETIKFINPVSSDTSLVDEIIEVYATVNNGYGYNMGFNSVDSLFSENLPIFDGIMGTFSFK